MRISKLTQCAYRFSNGQNAFQLFLKSDKTNLTTKRNAGRNSIGTEVMVPYQPATRQQVQQFFEDKQLKNKNVMLNIDSSHLLGIKRLISLQYMNTNVYKGNGEAVDILQKQNPTCYKTREQLQFEQTAFAITDPIFMDRAKGSGKSLTAMLPEIQQYYNSHPQRGVERLSLQYKVPSQYLYIFETAVNLNNNVYLCGLNEYQLREIVNSYLSLNEIKILFMQSLKYSAESGDINTSMFHQKSKEMLWKMHYSFLQPISYQSIHNMRQKIKGYFFANPFDFIKPDVPSINFRGLKDKENDSTKLQKNAILQVLFGNLWSQPYTNNPFPYLAQTFPLLSPEDKSLVAQLYNSFYNKYSVAKQKFGCQSK